MKIVMGVSILKTVKNIFPMLSSSAAMGALGYFLQLINKGLLWSLVSIILCTLFYFGVLYLFPSMKLDMRKAVKDTKCNFNPDQNAGWSCIVLNSAYGGDDTEYTYETYEGFSAPADVTAPTAVANVTLSDSDATAGIDGRDFTIGFDDSADDASDVANYKIYIYKDTEEPAFELVPLRLAEKAEYAVDVNGSVSPLARSLSSKKSVFPAPGSVSFSAKLE
jgi:hypothetical protein